MAKSLPMRRKDNAIKNASYKKEAFLKLAIN